MYVTSIDVSRDSFFILHMKPNASNPRLKGDINNKLHTTMPPTRRYFRSLSCHSAGFLIDRAVTSPASCYLRPARRTVPPLRFSDGKNANFLYESPSHVLEGSSEQWLSLLDIPASPGLAFR